MSYTALYRKFRPGTFDEVKGQDPIVITLKNQVRTQRIGHAYLFCGTRGTGKTTVAKILAKAVNCEHPENGSPCNSCPTCQKIAAQTSLNVIEIDAASNNGVANVRDIIGEVRYAPAEGKYKVYIIDEVHMLSVGAFNALLKTLEEPPGYVIFILATTEPHKIPVTIHSRCQRYDFARIGAKTIAGHLRDLAGREAIAVEDEALTYIAKQADGSLRDALSLFDRCIAFYLNQELTYDRVLEVLGAVDYTVTGKMFCAVASKDAFTCIRLLDDMVMTGKDLDYFVTEFIWYIRSLMLLSAAKNGEMLLDVSTEQLAQMKREEKLLSTDALMRLIRILSDLSNNMRYSAQKRVLLEIALIRLCRPQMDERQDLTTVTERLSALENQAEKRADLAALERRIAALERQGAGSSARKAPDEQLAAAAEAPEEQLPDSKVSAFENADRQFAAAKDLNAGSFVSTFLTGQGKEEPGVAEQLSAEAETSAARSFASERRSQEEPESAAAELPSADERPVAAESSPSDGARGILESWDRIISALAPGTRIFLSRVAVSARDDAIVLSFSDETDFNLFQSGDGERTQELTRAMADICGQTVEVLTQMKKKESGDFLVKNLQKKIDFDIEQED